MTVEIALKRIVTLQAEDLPEIAVLLKSKDARTQLDATVIIRKLLSLGMLCGTIQ